MASRNQTNRARSRRSSGRKSSDSRTDAVAVLKKDHRMVERLFKDFEKADDGEKSGIVAQICQELTVHAQVEEEIFYPALREAFDEEDLVDEAAVEHEGIKRLVAELEDMSPGDDLYDAKVTVLTEYTKHHVKEEEEEIFPKARKTKMDLESLGEALTERKAELVPEQKH